MYNISVSVTNLLCRKLDEIAAKQRQREEEAEARRAARKAAAAAAAAPLEPTIRTEERTAPRLNLTPRAGAPAGPSWRERLAAKEAAAKEAAAAVDGPKEEPQPVRKPGQHVPPHQRAAGTPGFTPREASPANGATDRYVPRPLREQSAAQPPSRTQTPAAASDKPEEPKPSTQKWVPRWKQQQQQQQQQS